MRSADDGGDKSDEGLLLSPLPPYAISTQSNEPVWAAGVELGTVSQFL